MGPKQDARESSQPGPHPVRPPNDLSRNLFLAASIISALSIPGHIFATSRLGINLIAPHLAGAADGVAYLRYVDQVSRVTFNYVNVGLFMSAVLQHRWSVTRGPRTAHDKLMLFGMVVGGGVVGLQFWRIAAYPPLGCLWIAPWCAVVGSALAV